MRTLNTAVRLTMGMNVMESLKNATVGVIMGIFMMLPGASGATIAVVFGIYERLIHDISSITKELIRDIRFALTVAVGMAVGLLICAKGLDFLIEEYEIPLMFFFATLILMQIPGIHAQSADGERVTSYNILAFVLGFAFMMAVLAMGLFMQAETASPGIAIMFFAGIVYAVCAISPGISGSTILLALGIFPMVVAGISDMSFSTLVPLALGAVVGVLLFSKFIDMCMSKHRKSTYMAILGLTAGSIVTVIVQAMVAGVDGIVLECVIAAVVGLVLGYGMHLFSRYYSSNMEQ